MITVEYDSNNSGGRWWLSDENWKALEAADWTVAWFKDQKKDPGAKWQAPWLGEERWLGALATSATRECETPDEAIAEWSRITGQDPWEEGCNCCGQPHRFSYEDKSGKTHYAESARQPNTFGGWS